MEEKHRITKNNLDLISQQIKEGDRLATELLRAYNIHLSRPSDNLAKEIFSSIFKSWVKQNLIKE